MVHAHLKFKKIWIRRGGKIMKFYFQEQNFPTSGYHVFFNYFFFINACDPFVVLDNEV